MSNFDPVTKKFLCECGCGEEVTNPTSKWRRGHYLKTEEGSRSISERMSDRIVSDETRRRTSESWKYGYKERCKAISAANMGGTSTEDPEERSRRRREEWADPEIRARRLNSIHSSIGRPETRELMSIKGKANWSNPEYKRRLLKLQQEGRSKSTTNLENLVWEDIQKLQAADWELNTVNKKVVAGMIPDFLNTKARKVVEVFGTYWHDELEFPQKKTEEETVQAYSSVGYSCLVLWGDEVKDGTCILRLEKFINQGKEFNGV